MRMSVRIYNSYADFSIKRDKLVNARKAYIKGLCAGLASKDNQSLWNKLFNLMRSENNSSDLSIYQLYEVLKQQLGDNVTLAVPDEDFVQLSTEDVFPQASTDHKPSDIVIKNEVLSAPPLSTTTTQASSSSSLSSFNKKRSSRRTL